MGALRNNKIPKKWRYHGFLTHTQSLFEFMSTFFVKFEHLTLLIKRDCSPFPVIPLPKLFDPFGLVLYAVN